MKTNKLDKSIQEKFTNRTFSPSASAWERLSTQLDEQPKQKKIGWFFYIGAAASILLLVTIGIQMFTNNNSFIVPNDKVVTAPIDTNSIDKKIDEFINEIPVEEAIVKKDINQKNEINTILPKKVKLQRKILNKKSIAKVEIDKVNTSKKEQIQNSSIEVKKNKTTPNPNSKIKVNADDLLYAVTHSSQEVKTYYAKYNVNREDILNTIQIELKKSNLKINPESILAEVERNISDDDFQNNFLRSLKNKVSDIASAIATRND